jgi:hypothetical protein
MHSTPKLAPLNNFRPARKDRDIQTPGLVVGGGGARAQFLRD